MYLSFIQVVLSSSSLQYQGLNVLHRWKLRFWHDFVTPENRSLRKTQSIMRVLIKMQDLSVRFFRSLTMLRHSNWQAVQLTWWWEGANSFPKYFLPFSIEGSEFRSCYLQKTIPLRDSVVTIRDRWDKLVESIKLSNSQASFLPAKLVSRKKVPYFYSWWFCSQHLVNNLSTYMFDYYGFIHGKGMKGKPYLQRDPHWEHLTGVHGNHPKG